MAETKTVIDSEAIAWLVKLQQRHYEDLAWLQTIHELDNGTRVSDAVRCSARCLTRALEYQLTTPRFDWHMFSETVPVMHDGQEIGQVIEHRIHT